MMTNNEYFIAQMKLRELRQQRSRLSQAYIEIEQQGEQIPTAKEQLQHLFTSLQKIRMAEFAMHPDVANLEPLLNGSQLSEESIPFWLSRLTREVPQGRLRSEIIYIFGALLEEWVHEQTHENSPRATEIAQEHQLLNFATQPAEKEADLTFLDLLFSERHLGEKHFSTWFQESANAIFQERITINEITEVLEYLSTNPNHTESIHRQAKGFLQDSMMRKEMADALSILLTHLDEWDWPQEGVHAFPLWTMNKWRLFLTYDLFTMAFIEILGERLQNTVKQFLEDEQEERLQQLHARLKNPPSVDPESHLQQSLALYQLADQDIWANFRTEQTLTPTLEDLKSTSEFASYDSVIRKRHYLRKEIQDACMTLTGYENQSPMDGMKAALQLINAEIHLTRTAFPQASLSVLKLDFKDFYPSLSHDFILAILERYGFSQSQLAYFRTFLQVNVQQGNTHSRFQRGMPLHHRFSYVFGEMVLGLFDQYILSHAHVQIIRMVDDICIIAPSTEEANNAWQAAQTFCEHTGLTLNQEKCGAVCLNGELSEPLASLPNPGWLLVKLDEKGIWQIDMEAFAIYHQQAQQEVLRHSSLLSQIKIYNLHVKHLVRAMAMESDLGEAHRRSIEKAIAQFQQAFFEKGHGMIEELQQAIKERFLDPGTRLTLPEAWFYWPITAGGCGLTQATMLASGYAEKYATFKQENIPENRPTTWLHEHNQWSDFYDSFNRDITIKEPVSTQSMEILINDFIQRGNKMREQKQTSLDPYWQWVLSLYGPQIIEYLGTIHFLNTELVPLQIILQHYQQALEVGEASIDDIPF